MQRRWFPRSGQRQRLPGQPPAAATPHIDAPAAPAPTGPARGRVQRGGDRCGQELLGQQPAHHSGVTIPHSCWAPGSLLADPARCRASPGFTRYPMENCASAAQELDRRDAKIVYSPGGRRRAGQVGSGHPTPSASASRLSTAAPTRNWVGVSLVSREAERGGKRHHLWAREPVKTAEERQAELMQAGERELHL